MQVSTSAWHYRVLASVNFFNIRNKSSVSLCQYFWYWVAAVGLALLSGLTALAGLFIAFVLPVLLFFGYGEPNDWVMVGVIWTGLFFLLAVATDIRYNWTTKLANRVASRERKVRKPSIPRQYLRALKQKVCPIIEFVDENDEEK